MTVSYRSEGRLLAHYPETVDLMPARWSGARLLAFSLFVAVLPMIMVSFPPAGSLVLSGAFLWAGWIGLALFGPATAYLVYRGLRHRVELRLTADGFTDDSSLTAVGFVPWSEVAGVSTEEISKATMIGVRLHDADGFIAKLSWFRRVAARTNMRMFGVPVWINPTRLADAEQIAALLDVYRRSWESGSARLSKEPAVAWPFTDGGESPGRWRHV